MIPGLECLEQTNIFTHTVSFKYNTVSVDTRTRTFGTNQYIQTHCQLMPGLECMEQTNIFTHTLSVLNTTLCQLIPGLECMEQTNIFTHTVSVDVRTRMYGTNQYIHTQCVS